MSVYSGVFFLIQRCIVPFNCVWFVCTSQTLTSPLAIYKAENDCIYACRHTKCDQLVQGSSEEEKKRDNSQSLAVVLVQEMPF